MKRTRGVLGKRRWFWLLLVLAPVVAPLGAFGYAPSDPLYYEQWALEKIGVPCAWQYTSGSPDVIVAVLDTGVDLGHPDLAGRLVPGYDFVDGDDEPRDENGHGTHVAGIIAAIANNDLGVAGIAPGVRIMPVRVLDGEGYGTDGAIADGLRYAADHGARVINMSLGSFIPTGDTIDQAVNYAIDRGVIVVIAAGNDYLPLPNFAGGLNRDAIVVAATDEDDVKASFSNSGPWVDISAPGVHIYSTMPTYPVWLVEEDGYSSDYDVLSGTSMATPVVSAAAALVISLHPGWSAGQVRQQLIDTAADISEQNPEYQNSFQLLLGSGRVDACAAFSGQPVPPPTGRPIEPTEIVATLEPLIPTAEVIATSVEETAAPLIPTAEAIVTEIGSSPAPASPTSTGSGETAAPTATPTRKGGGVGSSSSAGGVVFLVVLGLSLGAFFIWNSRRPITAPARRPIGPSDGGSGGPVVPGPLALAEPAPVWGSVSVLRGPHAGQTFTLSAAVVNLGRQPEFEIRLERDPYVSRRHACLWRQGRQVYLRDLGSSHGTYVNGVAVVGDRLLQGRERIFLGQSEVLLRLWS